MAEENNFNESNFKTILNEKCRAAGIEGSDFWNSMLIFSVKKRFDERNGKFGNDEDRRFAVIQRKLDPDYCIRQSAANNGTKQKQRRQIPQLKRRRVSFGASVRENAALPKVVWLNDILQPQSTFRPIFDPSSPLRFSRSIDPLVNGDPQFRQTSSNERSEGISMNESNIDVKTENIEERTSDPVVVNIDMSPAPSSSLNSNQNGAEFDDVASVHRLSPLPSISSMASATVSRSSSAQNVLTFQQQPTLGDEAVQQQIPSLPPIGQGNNQIPPAAEEPTNPFPHANVPVPAQLQQQQLQQNAQGPPQQQEEEVNNFQMLAAEIERLKRVNEYKEQTFLERYQSKMIDKLEERLNP
uniref:Uncharacterized protein n=1 Tax=Panagrolaimus davidi TaxID=227884 RepID=A0A914Q6U5_9BILA